MATRESQLWKRLGGLLPPGHYSRIESETSPGFPDVDYCFDGRCGQIELKVARRATARIPFKKGGLRKSQIFWIRERIRAGGTVHILAQVGRKLFLIPGRYAEEFNSFTLIQLEARSRFLVDTKQYRRQTLETYL